jgi:hypothetical protein
MLHTFSVEYIVAELTLMPDSVVVPIEDASAIHLIVLPVTHIILAIDLPIQTTAPLLVSEGIEAIAHKHISRCIMQSIVHGNTHGIDHTQVISSVVIEKHTLFGAFGYYQCIVVSSRKHHLSQIV